ncbi:LAFA_0E03752g1_1 [Lachancea sp. 'fantastica']|nr:LAFA_0E03752g1_1 [Lachancea sp. 'fantastica']
MKNNDHELLKATFWSEDYATGIKSLLEIIQNDVLELSEILASIKTYDSEIVSPAIMALKKLIVRDEKAESDSSLCITALKRQSEALAGLLEKMELSSHSRLESKCQIPLESLLFEYNEYLEGTKESTRRAMDGYTKHLTMAKQMQDQYASMAARLRDVGKELFTEPDKQHVSQQEDKSGHSSHAFPLFFDKSIVIEGEEQLEVFCNKLKESITTSKRLIAIPGISNEYFTGTKLLDALKRIEPKMDVSLFNIERVGQRLLAAGIIIPYQSIISAQSRFSVDDYFSWGSIQPQQAVSGNAVTPGNTVLGGFFKRFGGGTEEQMTITTSAELEAYQQEFTKGESSFFQQCQNLDYWRSELELELQNAMHHYWKLLPQKINKGFLANRQFLSSLQESFSLQLETDTIDLAQEVEKVYASNHSTVGFYMPQPGVTFSKYDVNGNLIGPSLFHSDLRDLQLDETGVAVIMRTLLGHLETFSADIVLKAWTLPLDLQRNSRLRRDCCSEFLASKGDHFAAITNILVKKGQEVNDVVGLLQSWLLELPDSLIPMSCYEDVKADGITGLRRSSKEHLLHLAAMCEHFQWLVRHCGEVEVTQAFEDRVDFPLYHVFARSRIQKPGDNEVMSRTVQGILCHKGNSQRLVEMLAADRESNVAKLSVDVPMQSSSAAFVPRPLKSLSANSSAASSRPASQRISGIDLFGRDT